MEIGTSSNWKKYARKKHMTRGLRFLTSENGVVRAIPVGAFVLCMNRLAHDPLQLSHASVSRWWPTEDQDQRKQARKG